jgi:hypothetical protein
MGFAAGVCAVCARSEEERRKRAAKGNRCERFIDFTSMNAGWIGFKEGLIAS